MRRLALLAAVGIAICLCAIASTAWATAATATLRFEAPAGQSAAVVVDGQELGSTPLSTEVAAGDHRVQLIWSDGRSSDELNVHLEPGDRRTLRLAAKSVTAPAEVLILIGDLGATVRLDGRVVGTGPIRLEITPGQHVIVIAFSDGTLAHRNLDVRPGAMISIRLRE